MPAIRKGVVRRLSPWNSTRRALRQGGLRQAPQMARRHGVRVRTARLQQMYFAPPQRPGHARPRGRTQSIARCQGPRRAGQGCADGDGRAAPARAERPGADGEHRARFRRRASRRPAAQGQVEGQVEGQEGYERQGAPEAARRTVAHAAARGRRALVMCSIILDSSVAGRLLPARGRLAPAPAEPCSPGLLGLHAHLYAQRCLNPFRGADRSAPLLCSHTVRPALPSSHRHRDAPQSWGCPYNAIIIMGQR